MAVGTDNTAAINVAKGQSKKLTHIEVHELFIYEQYQIRKTIDIFHVPGKKNPADALTKPLGTILFFRFQPVLLGGARMPIKLP